MRKSKTQTETRVISKYKTLINMPIRISGVNISDNKRIVVALTDLYGIGRSTSESVLRKLKIDENTRTNQLTGDEEKKIRDYIETNLKVEGDLRREVTKNIKHQIDVGTYRGIRHQKKLPVRGQRTRTNSRTVRGNVRRTAGSGRRPAAEKT